MREMAQMFMILQMFMLNIWARLMKSGQVSQMFIDFAPCDGYLIVVLRVADL